MKFPLTQFVSLSTSNCVCDEIVVKSGDEGEK